MSTPSRCVNRRECIIAGLGAALPTASQAQAAEIGSVFEWPAIQLLDGRTLAPSAWHGQGAVVVLWATYCPFCKRHNAHIDKLYRAGQPLRILGLALDTDAQAVRRYMAANDYRLPVALGTAALRARLTTRRVIPMTLLFDRHSRLLQAIPGEMFEEDVLELGKTAMRTVARTVGA